MPTAPSQAAQAINSQDQTRELLGVMGSVNKMIYEGATVISVKVSSLPVFSPCFFFLFLTLSLKEKKKIPTNQKHWEKTDIFLLKVSLLTIICSRL